ncbi:hypothetical protein BDV06DRAFT_185937 [Aspergillus oleicola]
MTTRQATARLLCLHRRSSLRPSFAAVSLPAASRSGRRTKWSSQYSIDAKRPSIDTEFLKNLIKLPKRVVPEWQGKKVKPWISALETFLARSPGDTTAHSTDEGLSPIASKSFANAVALAHHLNLARTELNRDLLVHLGFKLHDWSKVYDTLSKLLDAVDALEEASPHRCGAIEDWTRSLQLSLDELTDQDLNSPPQPPRNSPIYGLASLDASTYKPLARDYQMLLMAEVWKSLGTIAIYAVDTSPAKSKLAMTVVYRILARLHHSGQISDRVYKYSTPDSYQATFRPPGMHLLYSNIMDVLSDTAWLVHEADIAAKAAAAGQDAPFLPAKIDIKELGHEIWLEFILWCCVEHGHINEGIWLINLLKGRKSWGFQSWEPLLQDEEALRNTKLHREISTWPSRDSANATPPALKRTDPPQPFHGLGKGAISTEVVAAFLDNLPNLVYMGMRSGGIQAADLFSRINDLKFAIAPSPELSESEPKFLPTAKSTNWLATRVLETGGLTPEADPQMFDEFLKLIPHVVPPWSNSMPPVEEHILASLPSSQLYDETTAFTGMMEYNLRNHSSKRFCGSALNLFATLQEVMDTCKIRRVDEFFSTLAEDGSATLPFHESDGSGMTASDSSIPQLSNVTIAHLFDLLTTSRAFAFGEWLLVSDDVDGPTVPASAFGDQSLAPSLLRFAAATKNKIIGDTVLRALTPPISLNTLRSLLNYRILMHQWEHVIPTLTHVRDNYVKSWSHSNIAAITAEIIRLEHALLQLPPSDEFSPTVYEMEKDLSEAKKVLYRILFGEFDETPWRSRGNTRFQAHTLISFTRLFRQLPSTSLHEIADSVQESEHVPMYRLPFIPSTCFHLILAATVETHGILAAKNLYKRFCVSYGSPEFSRLVAGGLTRFYRKAERDFERGDPNFDAQYLHHLQKKMVFPNPNTVRILTQAAVREYEAALAAMGAGTQPESESYPPGPEALADYLDDQPALQDPEFASDVEPLSDPPSPSLSPTERLSEAGKTLVFCIRRFQVFRMSDTEISREVGEEFYSNYLAADQERREFDRRTKSELKRRAAYREALKLRLHKIEKTGASATPAPETSAPEASTLASSAPTTSAAEDGKAASQSQSRKERRKAWVKKQKLKEKLKVSEKARNDVKLNVLLDMTTRKRNEEPTKRETKKPRQARERAERLAWARQQGVDREARSQHLSPRRLARLQARSSQLERREFAASKRRDRALLESLNKGYLSDSSSKDTNGDT